MPKQDGEPQNQTKKRRQKAANHKPPKTKQEPEAVQQEQNLLKTLNRAGTGSPETAVQHPHHLSLHLPFLTY